MHVAIVGGGVVGLAAAHSLTDAGANVTLLERRALGSGSTERANGGIRTQFSTPANLRLSLASLPVWEAFEARFGVDLDFRQHGYLFLTGDADRADRFRDHVAVQTDHGVPSEFLDRDGVSVHTDLAPDADVIAGTYCPRDGYADPHASVRGFADAAAAGGATLRPNTPVTDLDRRGDGWTVETPDGTTDADAVVIAAGVWSPGVAEAAGVSLPVTPVRRQLALVEPDGDLPGAHPYTYHADRRVSFRPERAGTAIASGNFVGASDDGVDPDAYRTAVDRDFQVGVLERLTGVSAYFGPGSKPTGGWAGLYGVTPDHNPIVDEPRSGLFVATGFSGHGFMHAPAVGDHLAALIADAGDPVVDPAAFRLDRFDEGTGGEGLYL